MIAASSDCPIPLKLFCETASCRTNFSRLDAAINYSRYSKSIQLGFVEPYFLDKPILLGGQIFRRDYNSFNFVGGERNTTYSQTSTGGAIRTGFPLTEFLTFGGRYSLIRDKITLDKDLFYTDPDGAAGPREPECDPFKAGNYLCNEVGKKTTSSVGYSTVYDTTDGIRPTHGERIVLSQDLAGLGGNVKYLRSIVNGTKWRSFGSWVVSLHGEGGYIQPGNDAPGPFEDPVRLTDRFFGPQLRGFDIRGIGPRVQRVPYNTDGTLALDEARIVDALGGRAYYMGRLELEFPVGANIRNLGIRPSAFVDVGSLFKLTTPELQDIPGVCSPPAGSTAAPVTLEPGQTQADCPANFLFSSGFKEFYLGDSPSPRLSIGIGFNWVSPFGPIRLDLAKALLKQDGDDTKLFSFNVGTAF